MKLNSRIKKELFKRPSINYRSTMLWRAYLLFLGKKLSPSQKKNIGVANTWKPLNPERIISMYYEGYTIQKLSRKYNKTRTTIKLFLLRNKVTLRSRSASQIIRRKKEKKSNGHS